MRFFVLVCLLFGVAQPVLAAATIVAEPEAAYSVIEIEGDPYVERTYLGDLEDAPDLYELHTDVSMTLTLQLQQSLSTPLIPFGITMVRQNDKDGGVEEVIRQNESTERWFGTWSHSLGMRLVSAPQIQQEITPGTYRIEVSTPDNKGAYMLVVGEEPARVGYFRGLYDMFLTQQHFNLWPFQLLLSSYIYSSLIVVMIAIAVCYRKKIRRKRILWKIDESSK